MTRRLLLASGSPRRRELLTLTGLSFEIARPDIDETLQPGEPADQYVARLSREKSAAIQNPDALIISADTTVAADQEILGKPADAADAAAMLRRLRGQAHAVFTGITLRDTRSGVVETTVTATRVVMRDYTDAEIARYVDDGEPFDKAGAYGIQHAGFHPVARLEGCYANVMGLPLCSLCKMLAAQGIDAPKPVACDPAKNDCVIH